jgi:large subunit ribosomal protein L4
VRAQDGKVLVIEAISISAPKTKDMINLLEITGAEGNTLVLTNGANQNVWMSARNLDGVLIRPFGEESTYDVLWADTVIIEASALNAGKYDEDETEEPKKKTAARSKKKEAADA